MLVILTTHPIQYQVPLWQALAADGRVPFEVWYLTDHAVHESRDQEFGESFAWDIDLLSGYRYHFLDVVKGASPSSFWRCRLRERLRDRLRDVGAKAMWIQGWQVAAYWQAVREAKAAGVEVWLRGESNDLAPNTIWKEAAKRHALSWLFRRVDKFLYIGSANKRLYLKYGVPGSKLYSAPYAVDNARFAAQARALRPHRSELRRAWGIPDDAFCVLFCGKFVAKKRPADLVTASVLLIKSGKLPNIHLLFAGSGALAAVLKEACAVKFDAENIAVRTTNIASPQNGKPPASFVGFLNQTEISRAYVAADCLVLPSDFGETWGLVVNEALASELPCIVSDACGCCEDLVPLMGGSHRFECGNLVHLADAIHRVHVESSERTVRQFDIGNYSFQRTVDAVADLCSSSADELAPASVM